MPCRNSTVQRISPSRRMAASMSPMAMVRTISINTTPTRNLFGRSGEPASDLASSKRRTDSGSTTGPVAIRG
jgi:hypothetical protein